MDLNELIWTLIRRGLIAAGGTLVGNGFASADEVSLGAGALVTVLATTWSIFTKYRSRSQAPTTK